MTRILLQTGIFCAEFSENVAHAETQARALLTAARQVESSLPFKKTLAIVLRLGNYLNQGTAIGDAYGFELTSLLKVADLRSHDDAKYTLLHCVAKELDAAATTSMTMTTTLTKAEVHARTDVAASLCGVATAAGVDSSQLAADVRLLQDGVATVARLLDQHAPSLPSSSSSSLPSSSTLLLPPVAVRRLRRFHDHAAAATAAVAATLAVAQAECATMMCRFSFNVKKSSSLSSPVAKAEDFFAVLKAFVAALVTARAAVRVQAAAAAKAVETAAATALSATVAVKHSPVKNAGSTKAQFASTTLDAPPGDENEPPVSN
jgi:hypothetical protein